MNWDLLSLVPPILLGLGIIAMLYGAFHMWKASSKGGAIIYIGIAIALGILFVALYGKKIFG